MTQPQRDEAARCHLLIRGEVQGVGFRFFAVRQARVLGVAGFVRNRGDGSVEAAAEGLRPSVEAFIERMRVGPASATVREVEVRWVAPLGEEGFRIA